MKRSIKEKAKPQKRIPLLYLILAALFIWFVIIRPEYNIYKLKNEGREVTARVYRTSSVGSKGTIRCFYNFVVDGRIYEGFYDNKNLNPGDSLVVIYHTKDPNLNQAKQNVLGYYKLW